MKEVRAYANNVSGAFDALLDFRGELTELTAKVEKLSKQLKKVSRRTEPLDPDGVLPYSRTSLGTYLSLLEQAAERRNAEFRYGVKVRWRLSTSKGIVYSTWTGTVIPRPHDAREEGKEGKFVHVVTSDGAIRSCYPWNLELL